MTKKIIALVTISIFLLGLASCTVAGAELGLMGKWKGSFDSTAAGQTVKVTQEFEFKNDDTYTLKTTVSGTVNGMILNQSFDENGTIVKADVSSKKLTLKNTETEKETVYSYNLSGKKLTLENDGQKVELEKQ